MNNPVRALPVRNHSLAKSKSKIIQAIQDGKDIAAFWRMHKVRHQAGQVIHPRALKFKTNTHNTRKEWR